MGWKINGVPHTGQIITVGPSGRDFANPRDAFNAAEDGALVLLDPGTYPSATKDSTDHIYEWHTKKIYWRGMGNAPSDTVFDVNVSIYGLMISVRDMMFENIQFNPTSYGLLRFYDPITEGLVLNKCKVTTVRSQCNYSVVAGDQLDFSRILDAGVKFINVDFPNTIDGVFAAQVSTHPLPLSKVHVEKCIIPDNDPNGYYLTGTYALLDYVTSPTEGYGSNYGAYLITETQYSYLKNRRSRFDTFGRVLDVMEPCIRYLPFRGRDRFFNQGGHALNNQWMDGWSYRKWLTVSRASGAVTNYQMKLLVGESSGAIGEDVDCGGHCLSTFNDLRFTKADGITLLDYWIESISGTTPNQLATVWIEFDSIGTDATTFYMYYGKADAAAASNGANTFIFFDHFDGDLSKWSGDTAYASIASSILSMVGPSTPAVKSIKSTTNAGKNTFAFRTYGKLKQLLNSYDTIGVASSDDDHQASIYNEANTKVLYSKDGTTGSNVASNWTSDSYKLFDILVVGGSSSRYFENGVELTGSPKTSYPPNSSSMYARFLAYGTTSVVKSDWVLLRNYEATEPAWGSWGTEETL